MLDVLTGPLVGLTASDIRRLGRALRAAAPRGRLRDSAFRRPDPRARRSASAAAGARSTAAAIPSSWPSGRLRILLAEVHRQIDAGATPEEVLWTLWTGGTRAARLAEPAARRRPARLPLGRPRPRRGHGPVRCCRAARRPVSRASSGVRIFLDSLADQQIPAEAVADRGTRADAVRILTAHRAKGLEWDEVWIVGAEEGVWPDLRARGSTLRAEELTSTGVGAGPRPADLLEEERRLFYVACTRARRQLHVTAIDETDAGGDRPSRFVDDVRAALGGRSRPSPVSGRPRHQVSLDGLVAELPARRAGSGRLRHASSRQRSSGSPCWRPSATPTASRSCRWLIRRRGGDWRDPTVSERPVRDRRPARSPCPAAGSTASWAVR